MKGDRVAVKLVIGADSIIIDGVRHITPVEALEVITAHDEGTRDAGPVTFTLTPR